MDDEFLVRILLIVTIISLAMLHQYSVYVEKYSLEEISEDNYNGFNMIEGYVTGFQETNKSFNIELQINKTIHIIAIKNKFFKNLSLKNGQKIIVHSDFDDLTKSLAKSYFAKQLIDADS